MSTSRRALEQLHRTLTLTFGRAGDLGVVVDVPHTVQAKITRTAGTHLVRMLAPYGCDSVTVRTTDGSGWCFVVRCSMNEAEGSLVGELRDSSL